MPLRAVALATLYNACRLSPLRFAVGVVWSLDFLLLQLRVLALRPGIEKKSKVCSFGFISLHNCLEFFIWLVRSCWLLFFFIQLQSNLAGSNTLLFVEFLIKLSFLQCEYVPFLRAGVHRVSQCVIWVVLEGHSCCRVPLGVLLAEAFLGVRSEPELLTFTKLYQQDVWNQEKKMNEGS